MNNVKAYKKEFSFLKRHIAVLTAVICSIYALALFGGDRVLTELGSEDGITEWFTALLFLASSILFYCCFRRTKNIFLLGLAILFFFGAGEEISWGQRLFKFSTPEQLSGVNVQDEFNIHNLELLNPLDHTGARKKGLQRLLEIDVLFRIFSVCYCIFVPLYFFHIRILPSVKKSFRMPVPPFIIGMFIAVSWAIFNCIKRFATPRQGNVWQYMNNGEIFEFTASMVFFMISLYFFRNRNSDYLGKDIKQYLR